MLRIIVAALFALVVAGCGGQAAPRAPVDTTTPTPPATSTPTPSPLLTAKATAATVAAPARVQIPTIGVDAAMVGVGLNPDGSMETPAYEKNQAGWYTEGPRPGEVGPAVIAAHVDSKAGPDVFWRLRELEHGDKIAVVDKTGTTHRFTVDRLEQVDKDELPYKKIWGATQASVLRLITCGGSYDRSAGEYRDNLIVYADKA